MYFNQHMIVQLEDNEEAMKVVQSGNQPYECEECGQTKFNHTYDCTLR